MSKRKQWLCIFYAFIGALVAACQSSGPEFGTAAVAPADLRRLVMVDRSARQVTTASYPKNEKNSGGRPLKAAPAELKSSEFDVVHLLWGTTRAEEAVSPQLKFGSGRVPRLTLGFARITIPKKNRVVGSIPIPTEYTILNLHLFKTTEDPKFHFTVGSIGKLTETTFTRAANDVAGRAKLFSDHALIFVHGYNTSFVDGLFRAAQITYDMGFDGPSYIFSWPSKGELAEYLHDRDSANFSREYLIEYLQLISSKTSAKHIHVLAHSMGAKLVTEALFPTNNARQAPKIAKLDKVILAAADIDSSVLQGKSRVISETLKIATLYASDRDEALIASRRFAGNQPRAGDIFVGTPFIAQGVETIDISAMGSAVFWNRNHSKYAESAHVLIDIGLLLKNGTHPPDVRFPPYKPMQTAAGTYWRYVPN